MIRQLEKVLELKRIEQIYLDTVNMVLDQQFRTVAAIGESIIFMPRQYGKSVIHEAYVDMERFRRAI